VMSAPKLAPVSTPLGSSLLRDKSNPNPSPQLTSNQCFVLEHVVVM
jgi:hypothetical protein